MLIDEITELVRKSLKIVLNCDFNEHSFDQTTAELEITLTPPKNLNFGDLTTNVAMQIAGKLETTALGLAEKVAQSLRMNPQIDNAVALKPGFINIFLSKSVSNTIIKDILEQGRDYGRNDIYSGKVINLEYVSANPTGPIHLGGARWAAVGDSLARLYEFSGAKVIREYYFNDHGVQIERFTNSLIAAASTGAIPPDGYGGQYIFEIAATVTSAISKLSPAARQQIWHQDGELDSEDKRLLHAALATLPLNHTQSNLSLDHELIEEKTHEKVPLDIDFNCQVTKEVFRYLGCDLMFAQIKEQLSSFRTEFDVYFHEQSLYNDHSVEKAIKKLEEKEATYEKDGALWFASSKYGDEKDRVIIKSDGNPGYFAGDIAYYLNKRQRGADLAIYLLGADHHGYIGRMYALCLALGDTPKENMYIIIGQLVNLLQDGKIVRLSKRAGNIVGLDDLVGYAGVDAARYSLLRFSLDQAVDIDLDLITKNTLNNPVYYVQYAHARACSAARNARENGVELREYDPKVLSTAHDSKLITALGEFTQVIRTATMNKHPHRICRYLEELASIYHSWYMNCRISPRADAPVEESHVARLWLNNATRQVLSNGLSLLGVNAPERM